MLSDRLGAHRATAAAVVEPFDWSQSGEIRRAAGAGAPPRTQTAAPVAAPPVEAPRPSTAEIERDAFAKGYAQGERAGAEAAAVRGEGMLRRLAQTLEEIGALRSEMVHKTERQLVELAVAIASRIVHREVRLDRELLVAMARVAIDRLGEHEAATIRLNPDDFAVAGGARAEALKPSVRVIADPRVSAGGCLVESDFGLIDCGVDAQLSELALTLLGEATAVPEPEALRLEQELHG